MTSPCTKEESVHLFLDGELSHDAQPDLFVHLSNCASCRKVVNVMMEFRRMSRQEVILVPPAADEGVLAQLEQSKKRRFQRDRYYERRPLWQARTTLSFRTSAALAALFFVSGVMFPHKAGMNQPPAPVVEQQSEQRLRGGRLEFLYVWHPGLRVEANRNTDGADNH